MKIGLLLSGCGVYDGAEIQESVLAQLAIEEFGAECIAIGLDKNQHHVVNHITGEEMNEQRNMLVEASRLSRGKITEISKISPADLDALVIPGGFGSAKNFTSWAFDGPNGTILPEVKLLIVNMINVGKPIVALCVSPVVISKALQGSEINPEMTIGSVNAPSEYDIHSFSEGMKEAGVQPIMKTISEIHVDKKNKIITAPCYMMNANILEVRSNIKEAIFAIKDLI